MHWSGVGAALLALGVVTGAFGAHALRDRLDSYLIGVWEKAVLYHLLHALGLVIVPVLARMGTLSENEATRVCGLLSLGILLFSGSLYALVLSGVRVLGVITPIGGTAFIAGWLLLAFYLMRR